MFNLSHSRSSRSWLAVSAFTIIALLTQLGGATPVYAANETVTVDFALNGGAPTYRASGFIYGLSADASLPPQNLLTDAKIRFIRAGGSQLGCPNGGWVNGQYAPRRDFVRAYYAKARAVGATFIMILAPLWGSDGVCNVPRWPGDNGNWTEFTNFMTQVINDARAAGMTGPDVRWDIWNEPNIFFWGRSQSQYLEMWRRAVQQIRAAFPGAVIEGPSYAGGPASNTWWNTYLDFVRANNVVPTIMSWHALPGDPVADVGVMNGLLSSRGISVQGYSINEYGAFGDEQQPGPSAWYIARLERANGGVDGARANWGTVGQNPSLHATMGWLVTTNNQPMGQWWVYKRYADQTGVRTNITPSASIDGVVFQDSAARKSITLLGKKAGGGTGTVTVQFINVPSFLVSNGSVNVLIERMPSTNALVSAPTVVSNSAMALSGASLTVSINWSNALDAYAVTLTPAGGPPPPTNPIVRYQFDGNANDSSGNGRNGTLVNGPTFVAGRVGQAVNLDGSNDHVSLPAGIVNGLTNFTVATWVRLDTTGNWRRIFDFGTGTTVNMFLVPQSGSGTVRFAVTTGGAGGEQQINGSPVLPTGVWKHVAVTRSGNTATMFVDGVQVGQNTSMTLSPSSLGNTPNNWIGRSQYSADAFLDGQIDEFRIYNRALSAAEVLALFQNP